MADSSACLGHGERTARRNKVKKILCSPPKKLDENLRILMKKGPVSMETSLIELEENYASKPEWSLIEKGGLLSVPVEEFRMTNLPKPDSSGNIEFVEKTGKGAGNQIESYLVTQTISNLEEQILRKYEIEKKRLEAAGKSVADADSVAKGAAKKLPESIAVQKWLDNAAELKLKKALEKMANDLAIPALMIRSINLKTMSALNELGLKISRDGEIDLVLAFAVGDFLHVVICEVKRADTYPWQEECSLPNKQAVNKAESQLTKDVEVIMAILAGVLPSQIILHTMTCFPEASYSQLQTIFCSSCLEDGIVTKEDLSDLSALQKKTLLPEKPHTATIIGKEKLLTLTARCLSYVSLLHVGFREVEDKEKVATERHRYNLESVEKRMKLEEFVMASAQQQQVIAQFTACSTQRHLVLEGPAGTGKTLVALKVAENLMRSSDDPLLVVTAGSIDMEIDHPIMKYLDACTGTIGNCSANKIFNSWREILIRYGISFSATVLDKQLLRLAEGLVKKWPGRQIILLVDEILGKDVLSKVGDQCFPESLRMILVLNPKESESESQLRFNPSFLHMMMTTPYRSTIAITSLARFVAKSTGVHVPEGDFGSDVEGIKPLFFDIGRDPTEMSNKMMEALKRCREKLGDNVTLLYGDDLPYSIETWIKNLGKEIGGHWSCFQASAYFGWESDKIVVVTGSRGSNVLEMITRAKTGLAVIYAGGWTTNFDTKRLFEEASSLGLIEK